MIFYSTPKRIYAMKLTYPALTASVILAFAATSTLADTNSPFPEDNSTDHRVVIAMSGGVDSPFPEDNSTDHRVVIAMGGGVDSPFPEDNSTDHNVVIAKSDEADSPFPEDTLVARTRAVAWGA
jgi:hypothetical protein